ncbi:MAG: RNA polymerase sigma factor [Eggerthellaceae bacterium]|nr:RNA polymerase sigma factor [Eggerthellaceae bacterium]
MEDAAIVDLYWQREEHAIAETKTKYGAYCHAIARRILNNGQDAEECVNDTYLGAWNAMPPHRPTSLSTFLGKITRNLSLKRWRAYSAAKRGSGEVALSLDELEECVAQTSDVGERLEAEELARKIDTFLGDLAENDRRIFVCRYWHFDAVADIAQRFGFSASKVKMSLKRTRDKLAIYLEQEGVKL